MSGCVGCFLHFWDDKLSVVPFPLREVDGETVEQYLRVQAVRSNYWPLTPLIG
jgi:hypothetical protein